MQGFTKFGISGGVACLFWVGLASSAQAAFNYDFSYEFDAFTSIDGMIEGTLGADSDTITVNEVMGTVASTGGPLGSQDFSFDTTLGGFLVSGDIDSDPGSLSLSGSVFDLAVVGLPTANGCVDLSGGFCLIADDFSDFASVSFPGDDSQSFIFDSDAFSISQKALPNAEIPTPALLPGLIAMGAAALRKRKQSDESNKVV